VVVLAVGVVAGVAVSVAMEWLHSVLIWVWQSVVLRE